MAPSPFGHGTKQKSAKYTLKSRNQIIIKHAVEEAYATWYFSIVLISLRVEVRGGVEDTRLEAKDSKKFRGQGQGQNLLRPRPWTKDTDASVLHKKKVFKNSFRRSQKKGLKIFFSGEKDKKFFSGDLHERKTEKGLRKFSAKFLAFFNKILTVQEIVLSSSRGQGNFRGLEASRPTTSKCVLEDSTSGRSGADFRFFSTC